MRFLYTLLLVTCLAVVSSTAQTLPPGSFSRLSANQFVKIWGLSSNVTGVSPNLVFGATPSDVDSIWLYKGDQYTLVISNAITLTPTASFPLPFGTIAATGTDTIAFHGADDNDVFRILPRTGTSGQGLVTDGRIWSPATIPTAGSIHDSVKNKVDSVWVGWANFKDTLHVYDNAMLFNYILRNVDSVTVVGESLKVNKDGDTYAFFVPSKSTISDSIMTLKEWVRDTSSNFGGGGSDKPFELHANNMSYSDSFYLGTNYMGWTVLDSVKHWRVGSAGATCTFQVHKIIHNTMAGHSLFSAVLTPTTTRTVSTSFLTSSTVKNDWFHLIVTITGGIVTQWGFILYGH